MKRIGIYIPGNKSLCHTLCICFCPAKDKSPVFSLSFQECKQNLWFFVTLANNKFMFDVAVYNIMFIYYNPRSIGRHIILNDGFYCRRHCGREKPGMTMSVGKTKNCIKFLFKTHAEHLISLIKHNSSNR